MRPSALVERYRMALEVIASGPEPEPVRLTDEARERIVEAADTPEIGELEVRRFEAEVNAAVSYTGLSVNEAVEQARAEEPESDAESDTDAPDDEPEPIDMAALDAEVEAEMAEEVVETEPEREVRPQRRVVEKRGADGLLPTDREILAWIREKGEVTPEQVRIKFDISTEKQVRSAKTLIERCLIVAEGERQSRVYKPRVLHTVHREATEAGKARNAQAEREAVDAIVARTSQDKPTMPDPEPAPPKVEGAGEVGKKNGPNEYELVKEQKEAKRNGPGSDEGRVLEAVKYRPKWTILQHSQRLDISQDRVANAMRKLEEEFEVQSMALNGRVVWVLR